MKPVETLIIVVILYYCFVLMGGMIVQSKLVNSQLYENATISLYIYKLNQKYLKFN